MDPEKVGVLMIKRLRITIPALLLLSVAAFAGPGEDQLHHVDEQLFQALVGGRWQELDMLLADDFFYNTAAGTSLTKAAFIDYMKSGAVVVKRATRDQVAIRTYDDVAVVTGLLHVEAPIKGKDATLHSRYLHVWVHEPRGWRLAARQATYLSESR